MTETMLLQDIAASSSRHGRPIVMPTFLMTQSTAFRLLLTGLLLLLASAGMAATPVIVGGDRNYPPYEFLDEQGEPAGYNVDLTRAIAEVMGMEVEIHLGAWVDMRRALQRGEIDALQGMSYSAERAREVDFTPPHTVIHHSIFARKGAPSVRSLEELRGKRVAVQERGILHDYLQSDDFGVILVPVQTQADALRLLSAGESDYALVAKLPGLYLKRKLVLTNVAAVGDPVVAQKYGYAVGKGRAELRSRFGEGLAILKNTGRYQEIYSRWLGVLEPEGISWRTIIQYGTAVIGPLLLGLGLALLWSRTLKKEVAHRTDELAREVGERKRAMDELQLRQQQLIQADKLACLGVLVSGVAHEINNPNGMILLSVPRLMESYEDVVPILEEHFDEHGDFMMGPLEYSRMREEMPIIFSEMLGGANRIKRIVDDLKDFARREDSELSERVDLNMVVETSLRLVSTSIKTATEHFRVEYGESLPRFQGNSQRIEQIVVNLILNACQALPGREKGIIVKTSQDAAAGSLLLAVQDEGTGIAAENLARLTDPFFTTKRESGGTGLGLSVSAGIAEAHGGSLAFASDPGMGSTVTLTLPAIEKNRG